MIDKRLKPCPFCGGKAVIGSENYSTEDKVIPCMYVGCMECKCKSPLVAIKHTGTKDFRKTHELLLKAWNTRKPMERIVEKLEEAGFKFVTHGGNRMVSLEEAIEIVKGGGVDEVD